MTHRIERATGDRLKTSRLWLIAAYALATVLAQGVDHHHDGGAHDAHLVVGCDDPRAGMAGHETPDPIRLANDCVACQFRADHQAWLALDFHTSDEGVGLPAGPPVVSTRLDSLLRPSSRAPPRA
jgi:hypothetical protein